jgi:hypothetical protein
MRNMNDKEAIKEALTDTAERLWGPERAASARANIEEAAEYIRLIGEYPLTHDDAPLFHPPTGH